MAINKKFIHFKRKSTFQRELEAGNILNTSIVFIADAKQIYLNGSYFSENTLFNLSDLLNEVSGDLTDTDTSNEAIVKLYKYLKEVDSNTDSLIKVLMQEVSTLEETLTNRIDSTDLLVATELSNINQRLNTSENEITRLSESFKETDSITKILVEEVPSIEQTLTNRIDNTDLLVATELGNINQKLDNIENLINITYSELKSLRDSSKLVPGRWYRITDYECTTSASGTRSAGHQFDIVVLALSNNSLSEEARAIQHEEDTYFANNNLLAWKVSYTLDNDTSRFEWADTENGKGVIYRLVDEFGNECPYDFKNILFQRYLCADNTQNGDVFDDMGNQYLYWSTNVTPFTIFGAVSAPFTVNSGNSAYFYTFTNQLVSDNFIDNSLAGNCRNNVITSQTGNAKKLSNVVLEGNSTDNILTGGYNITALKVFSGNNLLNSHDIIAGTNFQNNTGERAYYLLFGNGCSDNNLGISCNNSHFYGSNWANVFVSANSMNVIGKQCCENYFGPSCGNNRFGRGASGNILEVDNEGNTLGDNCEDNILHRDCDSINIQSGNGNEFGQRCNKITIASGSYNKFGQKCTNITFKTGCNSNTFGDNCSNNTFGDKCNSNTFRNACSGNSFGNECNNNTFGNSFGGNTFGNDCGSNSFGNYCNSNSFGNHCYSNTFGDDCTSNSFGERCTANSFGMNCDSNTLGNSCFYNSFGNDCGSNSFGYNFQCNALGNDVQYIEIPTEKIYHIQILNGTKGTRTNNLTIEFTPQTIYSQFAGFTSKGELKIWNPADLNVIAE